MSRFSFGATADPVPNTPPPVVAGPTPAAPQSTGLDALFAAIAQSMAAQSRLGAGRLGLQNAQTFGRHLGAGGGEITADNPLGYAGGSPFSNGFFNQGAASLTPEARQATQGNTAMTQFARQGQVPGVDATKIPPVAPLPSSNPEPPVDQYSDPFFNYRLEHGWLGSLAPMSRQLAGLHGTAQGYATPGAPVASGPQKGSAFSFGTQSTSPRPGFRF